MPISKDGLYHDNYNTISYSFVDPIGLIYEDGEISGQMNSMGGDLILISNNEEVKLLK